MVNGKYNQTKDVDCVNRPAQQTWFTLKVKVISTVAWVYLDGVITTSFTPHYPLTGNAAVFVWTGYNNIAFFKHYKITPDI